MNILYPTTFESLVLEVINDLCLYLLLHYWMYKCNILILSFLLFLLTDIKEEFFSPLPPFSVIYNIYIYPFIYMCVHIHVCIYIKFPS